MSLGYTAPPLKFVYRGLGEIAVAVGFGPLMLLGGYVVQTRGALSWEPFVASLPIALLVALILYVNEIPDRRGDARAGKRTLPVRLSKATVIARLPRRGDRGLRDPRRRRRRPGSCRSRRSSRCSRSRWRSRCRAASSRTTTTRTA